MSGSLNHSPRTGPARSLVLKINVCWDRTVPVGATSLRRLWSSVPTDPAVGPHLGAGALAAPALGCGWGLGFASQGQNTRKVMGITPVTTPCFPGHHLSCWLEDHGQGPVAGDGGDLED